MNAKRHHSQSLNGLWQAAPALDEFPPQAGWREMRVPANWHLAGFPDYAGRLVYRHRFPAPDLAAEQRAFLRFSGVDYFADVWLNGAYLGSHEGYFAPFEFDATPHLQRENELLVRVESPREPPGQAWPNAKQLIKGVLNHHDCRPGSWDPDRGQDGNTGGIWNDVTLEVRPATHLCCLRVAPVLLADGSARLLITVDAHVARVENLEIRVAVQPMDFDAPECAVRLAIPSCSGAIALPVVLSVPDPHLWWTWDQGDQPLYGVEATLLSNGASLDSLRERVGIRQVEITPDWEWHLNGRRIFPRGTNIIPTQWLSEYTPERIAEDIHLLRQANVNAIRVHAHVNRSELYAACDEAGILVWQDFALQWSYDGSDEFAARACRQIGEMVRHLYNHPSIAVWCCHNEPSVNRHTLDPVIVQAARAADPTRYVDIASDFRFHPYPGWYYGDYREFSGLPGAPFVSEFGAQALPGMDSLSQMLPPEQLWPPDWKAWAYHDFQYDQTFHVASIPSGNSLEEFVHNSQQYQARLLQYAVERYRKARFHPVTGIFQFMFVDCWPAITWSVLDYWRRPKAGYAALQRAYQPVLVMIDHARRVEPCGRAIEIKLSIVNDLPRAFPQAALRLWLEDSAGGLVRQTQATLDLPPDCVVDLPHDSDGQGSTWSLPSDGPLGTYRFHAELTDAGGTRLSYNEHAFEVVAATGPS